MHGICYVMIIYYGLLLLCNRWEDVQESMHSFMHAWRLNTYNDIFIFALLKPHFCNAKGKSMDRRELPLRNGFSTWNRRAESKKNFIFSVLLAQQWWYDDLERNPSQFTSQQSQMLNIKWESDFSFISSQLIFFKPQINSRVGGPFPSFERIAVTRKESKGSEQIQFSCWHNLQLIHSHAQTISQIQKPARNWKSYLIRCRTHSKIT